MNQVKAAIVGYGLSGKYWHAYLISLEPRISLCGIVSGSAEKRDLIRKEQGCKAYASFEEAITDPQVQLVIIATPNSTHCDYAVRALEAGKHVVTDKIMSTTLAQCNTMIAAAKRTGKFLTVFQNRRFDGDYLTVKKLMADGDLGDVRWFEMSWQRFQKTSGWRSDKEMGGGWLYDLGAHMLDQMCLLMPQGIGTVYCVKQYDYKDVSSESHGYMLLRFDDGATGVIDASAMNAISKPRMHISGTKGAYCKFGMDPQEAAMRAGNITTAKEPEEEFGTFSTGDRERIVPTMTGRWQGYYENIAAVLLDGAKPVVDLREVRRCMQVFDAAILSADENRVVQVNIPPLTS